jgi:ABC-2 type transport system permease protein
MFVILYVVFVKFLKIGDSVPHFPIYLLLGIVLWNFFTEMTSQSLGSVVGRGDLIRKIRIPRWIIVLSSSIAALINLGLNLIVVAVFLVINQVDITFNILWLPLILLEVYLFALGVSLFLSAAYVKFRDVSYIWEVFLQAGFYLTPILYPLSVIPNLNFQKLLLLNPMAQAIQDARYSVVTKQSETTQTIFHGGYYALIPFLIIAAVLTVGILYFKKESKYFAENM